MSDVLFIDEIDYHDVLKELGEERESEWELDLNEKEKEIVSEAEEYLKAESGTSLLQHVGVDVRIEK